MELSLLCKNSGRSANDIFPDIHHVGKTKIGAGKLGEYDFGQVNGFGIYSMVKK